jgi:predicted metal-dependent peptidase
MTKAVVYLNKQNVQNAIYLTDGMLSYPSVDPKFNLIIGLVQSKKVWDKKFEKHKIIEIQNIIKIKIFFNFHFSNIYITSFLIKFIIQVTQ